MTIGAIILSQYNVSNFLQRFIEDFNFSRKSQKFYNIITIRTVMYNNALPELKMNAQNANGSTVPAVPV